MLSAVDRAQLSALLDVERLHLLTVLPPLEAVQQVVAERFVEVDAQTGSHFCCETFG